MAKEPLTTRLDADTKREVENYADEHEIGQTEAARRLIRAGLAEEGHPVTAADGSGKHSLLETLASGRTMLAGALIYGLTVLPMFLAAQFAEAGNLNAAALLLLLTIGLTVAAVIIMSGVLAANLALGRPLRALVLPWEDKA
jgi:hypothetical protein